MKIDLELLQNSYELTPAEAEVAVTLLGSSSAQEVAEILGTSYHTVHAYIKQIYSKLGIDSRARFVKLMLGLASNRS